MHGASRATPETGRDEALPIALQRGHLYPEQRTELRRQRVIREPSLECQATRAQTDDAHPRRIPDLLQQIHVVIDAHDAAAFAPKLAQEAVHLELLGGV